MHDFAALFQPSSHLTTDHRPMVVSQLAQHPLPKRLHHPWSIPHLPIWDHLQPGVAVPNGTRYPQVDLSVLPNLKGTCSCDENLLLHPFLRSAGARMVCLSTLFVTPAVIPGVHTTSSEVSMEAGRGGAGRGGAGRGEVGPGQGAMNWWPATCKCLGGGQMVAVQIRCSTPPSTPKRLSLPLMYSITKAETACCT